MGDDYVLKRAQYRNSHLEKAWKASEKGELILGGALQNPNDLAILLFKGDSPEAAENFARTDPYVINGLVKRWYVRFFLFTKRSLPALPLTAGPAIRKSPL